MDIGAAITVAGETLRIVKGLKDLDHALDKAELKSAMADLYSNLADVRIALSDAQGELHQRNARIAELEAALENKATLKEVDGFMYAVDEQGNPKGLPFCAACLANGGKQVRPAHLHREFFKCPSCDALYNNLKSI